MKIKTLSVACLAGLSLALAACSSSEDKSPNKSASMPSKTVTATKDIVDTAVAAGSFNTLASLLTQADLIATLKGEGPFTVFAPTDEAFAKVPKATLEALGKDPTLLKKVLTYHVVSGKVMKDAALKLSSATMVSGDSAKIEVRDGSAYIAGAKIIQTDIAASNGVIHVIDSVMLPEAK